MSNNAEILNAILDLKTHIDGRFERVEQRLDRLEQRADGVDQRLDRMDQRLDGMNHRLDDMNHRLKDLQVTTHNQGERISRMEGRLDEQSRILAALIPTRVAAVPPAAE
ncbi:hypothetical protein [Azospirillum lipoferum]|uniref:t-SNARE coiled-coil homology domain-containing protein n=1 Tax=Azospirillum lipoferum (strain 4B) TaxID=862719 RepID=G7Z8T3_AZOL4|nr:hypothetical protein [Azospirillum lipoferum]CBS87381.1 protein of unknown function; putative coiled-coil and ATPase domains [Azospirillum lipoferum 4B]